MRRNNPAKRFGIASLCLGVAVSAVSGMALLGSDVALAIDDESAEPFSIITSESPYTKIIYDGGVRLSSDSPYKETINNVFYGDTTMKFSFPETFDMENKWFGGQFTIRVTDAEDETDYFDIVYYSQVKKQEDTEKYPTGYSTCLTNMVIEYNGLVRGLSSNQKNIETTRSNNAFIVAPAFLTHYQNGHTEPTGMSTTVANLSLDWNEDGVLSIKTNSPAVGTGNSQYTIAAFDGSYDPYDANDGINWSSSTRKGTFGLPKLSFENGYKLSFLSDFTVEGVDDHATDVCIQEITTSDTTTKYTDYKNTETITIFERGNAYKAVEVGDELIIPMATYADNQEVVDVQVFRPNGQSDNVTPGKSYKVKAEGVHYVTYTTYGGSDVSVAAFSFTAGEWATVQTTNFVHTAANVTQDEDGLRISSENAYKATFKGIFTGDTTLKFKFPETYDKDSGFYGDFTFRITDAKDDNNYFDIKYYVASGDNDHYTGVYVQYGDEVRQCHQDGTTWYTEIQKNTDTVAYAPSFLSKNSATYGNREGILSIAWTDDVLAVQANTGVNSDATLMRTIAAFDGTNSFVDQESWGLPKINLENGYTISVSSSFNEENITDHGSDVLFSSIENNSVTYDFSETELIKDDNMQAFSDTFRTLETAQTMTGKVFLGWKNTKTKEIYPAYSVVRKVTGQSYETVVMVFDTVSGAGVRFDASKGGKSGIRFQTFFNVDEYEALKDSIQSFGTIVAYTDTLTKGDFTIENYKGAQGFTQVENTKGTYEYTDKTGETYTAYSMAVVDIADYTREYSARGYLVVEYADGSTQTIYTDYNVTDNSICIAAAAHALKTLNSDFYNQMTKAVKNIIDGYAAAYVEPKN